MGNLCNKLKNDKKRDSGIIRKKSTIVNKEKDLKIDTNMIISKIEGLPQEHYNIKKKLGEGSYGCVFRVEHKQTGLIRAMKTITKNLKSKVESEQEILNEIDILRKMDHPGIVKIFEFYNCPENYSLITEYCPDGELFTEIADHGPFSEPVAARIMYQLFSAINYCHSLNIIHRDLKPENILIEKKSGTDYSIKVIDFGTAKLFEKNKSEKKVIGSSYYIAPEVLSENYNQMCDLWSCGVILYILLSGKAPFSGKTDSIIFEKIKIGKYNMNLKPFNDISSEAKDLINNLLQVSPNKRLTAQKALDHSWFKKLEIKSNCIENDIERIKKSLVNIRKYNPDLKLQQVVIAYLVHNIPQLQIIKDAYKIFLTFDENMDGKITKNEMITVFKKMLKMTNNVESEVDVIFKKLDNDDNGYIEYEEFVRASIDKNIFLREEILQFAFKFFDKDNSGEITVDELKEILCQGNDLSANVLDDIISKIDKDGNKVIDYDEFTIMMREIMI